MSTIINPGIEIFVSKDRGRGVCATQAIRAGTCLVREQPFAHALLEHERERRCEHCLQKREKLQKCGSCKDVLYCSNDCQIPAYKTHQYECKLKKKNSHELLPDWSAARLMIQVLNIKQKKKKKRTDHSIPSGFALVPSQLCDGSDRLEGAAGAVKCLEDYVGTTQLPGWDHDSLMKLYAKLYVNTFCLYDEELRVLIGEAVCTRSAMFNHNCEPNCSFIFNGKTMEIRSLRDIKPGEECFIHYVNVLQTVTARRQRLYKHYRFWCNCARCERELKMLSEVETSDRLKLDETHAKASSFLTKIDNSFNNENYYEMLETCQAGLTAVQDKLDPTSPIMAELHIKTQEAFIGLHRWEEAVKSGMKIIQACKTHLLPTDPILGFHLWRVAKIQAVQLNQPIAAKVILQQAIDVMSIGYGSTHPMTMEVKELLGSIMDQ